MRSRLRLTALICLTVWLLAAVWAVTAIRLLDRTADLLVSCMDGETPVTTVQAGDERAAAGCWTATEPPSSGAAPTPR
jgi:hypothetical protein